MSATGICCGRWPTAGRSDVIFDMNHQSEKPGYGYQLAHGATSLTEAWNADRRSSQNHFMLGHLVEWLYHDLAGIGVDPSCARLQDGYASVRSPSAVIEWVKASLDTIRGTSHDALDPDAGGRFSLQIVIPPNTNAPVSVPVREGDEGRWSMRRPAAACGATDRRGKRP